MKINKMKAILCFMMSIFLFSCSNFKKEEKDDIIIFASASLMNPLSEICTNYQKETGKKIGCSFDSSGRLREQIQSGAYSDLYFSASASEMNILKSIDFLYNDSITNILKNDIVLVMPKDSDMHLDSFLDLTNDYIEKIAVGESMTSSIGQYTEEILKKFDIYDIISDKIIFGKDTREVIDLVKNDKIDCGIVYITEAILNNNNDLQIAAEPKTHMDIVYSIAVLKKSLKEKEARDFINYLFSEKSLNILKDYGFGIVI
ncbi:molybdate ABC transporter substrate-binding protein [Brachyspira hyodysenteriae]|uniref:molybdate ABC transporter substrate-binding protein n=1 Tax=Brachyspira hyodysenteriae TaxID=159 RepID=UPI0022CDA2FC|nr:molybdate ABC transporter substrate-binding protein [Brachyspira hyodysenteriae]MCZ9850448.1 molybdate ABC transporter substrate-binding protein [Brachyspira hyodysenteriae]MCZ9860800.1 molybdate ABC transporter substrate-binding protein [Brachyspira hyodysenteriae]MCZ9870936.1 molybdate ABC transporter substrate-binding protein [Brachyspira hyodysenteriae]MCZ9876608.1 molybdate ABC transporter substrate-binding protein [Brachyspira hyodysenteriae]MCZ9880045.1 molybdate ABC transporter subs